MGRNNNRGTSLFPVNTDSQALESCLTRINVTSYCILSEMKLWREIKIMSELKGAYSR